jgi:F1F0 ATPase subunit 2
MNASLALLFSGLAGALLGLFFFGGLWWTLRRALVSPRPALWVGGSMLLRMGCTAGGFVVVSAGDWQRLLACLFGFLVARWLVVRFTAGLAASSLGVSRPT